MPSILPDGATGSSRRNCFHIPDYLRRMLGDYLKDWALLCETGKVSVELGTDRGRPKAISLVRAFGRPHTIVGYD